MTELLFHSSSSTQKKNRTKLSTIDHFSNAVFPWNQRLLWRAVRINIYLKHYGDVIMGAIASQITSLAIVYSTVYYQRKHQSSASLAVVWGINRGSVNSPHKWPITRKMFPFDDVIMNFATVWILYVSPDLLERVEYFYSNCKGSRPAQYCILTPVNCMDWHRVS